MMEIPYFDGCGPFRVEGPEIVNVAHGRIPAWWLRGQVDTDWPLVLLAVSAGYLAPSEVVEFAFRFLSEDSPKPVYDLAILAFENDADCSWEEAAVAKIASSIEECEWALAREKLFYAAACWMHCNSMEYSLDRYDLSVDLVELWEDLGRPENGRRFFFSAPSSDCGNAEGSAPLLEIPWSAGCEDVWQAFAGAESARLRPAAAPTAIVADPGVRWTEDLGTFPVIPNQMVAEPMGYLLGGDDPVLRQLRRQYRSSRITEEENTGCGFFVEFQIPDDGLRLSDCRSDFCFGDVYGDVEEGMVGFIVFVCNGFLALLEAYSGDGRGWPPREARFRNIRYEPVGETSSKRDMEGIRDRWLLPSDALRGGSGGEDPFEAGIGNEAFVRAYVAGGGDDAAAMEKLDRRGGADRRSAIALGAVFAALVILLFAIVRLLGA